MIITEFRAGENGPKSNNVNFARDNAQVIANKTGEPVPVIPVRNGIDQPALQVIEPNPKCEVFQFPGEDDE